MRRSESGGMLLLYLIAAGLFSVSALVLMLAHQRMEKVRVYASEAAARSAARSGLARAEAALGSGDLGYEGEELSWPGGQEALVRVFRRGDQWPTYEVSVRGSCQGPRGRQAVRSIRAIFETREGRVVLITAELVPRAELAQLR